MQYCDLNYHLSVYVSDCYLPKKGYPKQGTHTYTHTYTLLSHREREIYLPQTLYVKWVTQRDEGEGHIHNRVLGFVPTTSYLTHALSLLAPNMK